MLLRTDSLADDKLDWAVALALTMHEPWLVDRKRGYRTSFSGDWGGGGWLLEQCVENGMLLERVDPVDSATQPGPVKFKASLDKWQTSYGGPTLLVAVCRAYVAYKLGIEVDVPQDVLDLKPQR